MAYYEPGWLHIDCSLVSKDFINYLRLLIYKFHVEKDMKDIVPCIGADNILKIDSWANQHRYMSWIWNWSKEPLLTLYGLWLVERIPTLEIYCEFNEGDHNGAKSIIDTRYRLPASITSQ